MNWEAMFTSDYIRAVDFGARTFSGQISEVRICKLEDEKTGKPKDKGVVFFRGHEKGWVLCKTNAICLAAMFGPETDGWVGKHVTLYSAMVSVGKEKKPGIRIRGSSDLSSPLNVEVKLPRKKAFSITMQVTGKAAPTRPNGSATPPASAPPPTSSDPEPTDEELAAAAAAPPPDDDIRF